MLYVAERKVEHSTKERSKLNIVFSILRREQRKWKRF